MKTKIFLPVTLLIFTLLLTSSSPLNDEDCNAYFPLTQGTKWVYNDYNKKGKLESISSMLVKDVKSLGEKTEFILHVKEENPNPKKNEEPFEKDLIYYCENGIINFDMSSFIPKEYNDTEISMKQKHLTLPSTLNSGQKLEDAQVMVYVNNMKVIQIDITDRKVEKMESITTKAGTFDCAIITSKQTSKLAFMSITYTDKQWYSNKVGQVKSETYDKKGNMISHRELVEFSTGS